MNSIEYRIVTHSIFTVLIPRYISLITHISYMFDVCADFKEIIACRRKVTVSNKRWQQNRKDFPTFPADSLSLIFT
ncbi:hypothetical protein SC1083_2053 [Aggregatibacter actinomycetemcomitans serotype e str. SC1083]|uniref:Uncharacterized protein n=1 Tax=Aggregatibacter actinomycetemcomitans serotype e str. SC1083 TaxID=907488 RepID=G4AB23_AGGAC|nr:hypothetical protein SC1083_2053 [Aggregatibacter actinomycetemcomitans serotype e str. SC1083]